MSSSSQGDEARRALADKLDRWAEQYGAAFGMTLHLSGEELAAVRTAIRAEPVRAVEEMESELRPFASGEGEGLDEIVVHDSATVHAETMSATALWIGISDEAGGLLHVWVNAVRRKGKTLLVMTASDEGERDTIRALPIQPAADGGADE